MYSTPIQSRIAHLYGSEATHLPSPLDPISNARCLSSHASRKSCIGVATSYLRSLIVTLRTHVRRSPIPTLADLNVYQPAAVKLDAVTQAEEQTLLPRVRPSKRGGQYRYFVALAASSGKRNVTVWRPSVCPSACLSVLSATLHTPRLLWLLHLPLQVPAPQASSE